MERMASRPAHNRVQPDGSHPTKPKQKQVPSRPGAMPQHPPSRPPSVFDGSDAPRPAATRGCRHHSQRGRFVKVSCMKKDSTKPGMATALRTCPVTPCRVQHGAHGLRPATTVRPSPRQVQHGAHGLPACGAQVRPESIPKPRDFNIYLNISGLLIFRIT